MSIAITGANGFLGTHLRHRLTMEKIPYVAIPHHSSIAEMTEILKAERVRTVVHLASVFLGDHQPDQVDLLIDSNVGFGTRVLEACALSGVKNLVITGSSWQHYHSASVNLYGALKNGLEAVARYYSDAQGMAIAFLKLYDSFGENDPRPKLVPQLLASFRNSGSGTPLRLSPGDQIVDFTHVQNSVEALLKAAEWTAAHPGSFQAFRVTGREPMSLRDFVTLIEKTVSYDFKIEWGSRPYRNREVMNPWIEAPEVPGYQPLLDLRDGIRKVFL